jgi:hypothetical protein
MNNTTDRIERNDDLRAEQLTLLTVPAADARLRPSAAHARFRLSAATRRRGLEHVAEIRRQLAATHDESTQRTSGPLPPRRNVAA